MSRLDDEEQSEYLDRWSSKQRKMQAEILKVRFARRDGAISGIEMWAMIIRIRIKYRRMP